MNQQNTSALPVTGASPPDAKVALFVSQSPDTVQPIADAGWTVIDWTEGSEARLRDAVAARLAGFPASLEEASQDLGATYWQTLFKVTLPICAPAILAAFLSSFTTSFDEFAVSFFLSGSEATLPIYLYSQLRFPLRLPIVVTLAAVVMVASIVLLSFSEWLRRRE